MPSIRNIPASLLRWLVLAAGLVTWATDARAEDLHFWNDVDYGSESQFSPLTAYVNGSFDILRNLSYQHDLTGIDYLSGAKNVWFNSGHPIDAVGKIGLGSFVAHEVIPFRGLETQYGQFVPNWFMHALGEGALYRKLEEWYAFHGVPHPRVVAIATTVAMQWTNEIVENGAYRGTGADSIADILLFNVAGYLLFSVDDVARVFRHRARLLYWPGQAVIAAPGLRLINHGENYAFQVDVGLKDLRLFGYFGVQGLFGATLPVSRAGDNVSVGVGYRLLELRAQDVDGVRTMLPGLRGGWEGGLFWDRNGSLMVSAIAGAPPVPSLHVNVYPGVLSVGVATFGMFAKASQVEGISGGILFGHVPIGLGGWSGEPVALERFH
jgi:hypothetical protein